MNLSRQVRKMVIDDRMSYVSVKLFSFFFPITLTSDHVDLKSANVRDFEEYCVDKILFVYARGVSVVPDRETHYFVCCRINYDSSVSLQKRFQKRDLHPLGNVIILICYTRIFQTIHTY